MDVGIRQKLRMILDFFPENHSKMDILRWELNDRIAALTSRANLETLNYSEEEWDNLILLDGCRYDVFSENNTLEGDLKKRYSNASHTWNFLKRNFREENKDTVYVTASPMSLGYGKYFADIVHVWTDSWDKKGRTVRPEDVTDAAIEAKKKYPNKKLFVHYMQPHYPFIGEKGEKLGDQGGFSKGSRKDLTAWEKIRFEDVTKEEVRSAYVENLEIVLPEVKRLLESLDGKSVVTSDHGNLFGKKIGLAPSKIYGHPRGVEDKDLRAVPWLEIGEKRSDITETSQDSNEDEQVDEEEIKDKLSDLGYG